MIIGFIMSGLILNLGGFSSEDRIGFRYWKHPYPLFQEYILPGTTGQFLGFWSAMTSAAFAFGNVQVVAIAGAETRNPRTSIPKALRRTFFRVVIFYVLSILIISLLVPADDGRLSRSTGTAAQSPFVIALERTGYKVSAQWHLYTYPHLPVRHFPSDYPVYNKWSSKWPCGAIVIIL